MAAQKLRYYRFGRVSASSIPGLAAAALPKCPLCFSAALSAAGISLPDALSPLSLNLILLSIGILWFSLLMLRRRRFSLFCGAASACVVIFAAKSIYPSRLLLAAGILGLFAVILRTANSPSSGATACHAAGGTA